MYSSGSSRNRNDSRETDDFSRPEHQSMISITSYQEMREIIENFVNSKRRARDAENNYHFLKPGPKSNCARIDAVYNVRAGVTSHIKVQDRDQYWAEEERKFPHLKEIHLEEEFTNTANAVTGSTTPESREPSVSSRLAKSSAHPFLTPNTSPERAEDVSTPSNEAVALKRAHEWLKLVPGITQSKDVRPPPKKARLEIPQLRRYQR